jgi:hypothetical protein
MRTEEAVTVIVCERKPLRQERPKTQTVKASPSWWVGLSREAFDHEVARRQPSMSASEEAQKVSANTYGGATMRND